MAEIHYLVPVQKLKPLCNRALRQKIAFVFASESHDCCKFRKNVQFLSHFQGGQSAAYPMAQGIEFLDENYL